MREKFIKAAKRVVIKLGTSVVADEKGKLDRAQLRQLAQEISILIKEGKECVLVTSGAIAAGVESLGFSTRPRAIPKLQAAASVGQGALMSEYASLFSEHGVVVGQVLLTQFDFVRRELYVNACNTLHTLLSLDVLPIINENDATAVEEIKFGDNDILAALVSCSVEADLLIILTDTEGFYKNGKLLPEVREITDEIEKSAGGAGTHFGSGGMVTKLQAARIVGFVGIPMIVASGRKKGVLKALMSGEKEGTFFYPASERLSRRKHWIAFVLPSKGKIFVDKGAKEALVRRKKSLLPVGVVDFEGEFEIGDAVEIAEKEGKVFAKGITSYSSKELAKVKGLRSKEVYQVIPEPVCEEVVHRDSLVILKN
jgi:glutamate 5-kinase